MTAPVFSVIKYKVAFEGRNAKVANVEIKRGIPALNKNSCQGFISKIFIR
jgi:hypothetical protein